MIDANEREELATLIRDTIKAYTIPLTPGMTAGPTFMGATEHDIADAILAAGYARPPM